MTQAKPPAPPSAATELPASVAQIADAAALAQGLAPSLVRAVIWIESRGRSNAKSGAGAMGLMQLMPRTAADMGVVEPYDAMQNVAGGTRYLRRLLGKYHGDVALALAAYNWGPGNVDLRLAAGSVFHQFPQQVQTYVHRVLERENHEAKGGAAVGGAGPLSSSLCVSLECPWCEKPVALEVGVKRDDA